MRSLAIALFLMACSKNPNPSGETAPPSAPPTTTPTTPTSATAPATPTSATAVFSSAARPAGKRSDIPAAILPNLPKRGIYAAGGGLTSSAWRVVVDIDDQGGAKLSTGSTPRANASSLGKPDKEAQKPLDAATVKQVVACADRAWREPRKPNDQPTADYDEILIVVDGDAAFFLEGFGPIRGGAAATCLEQLRGL